MTERLLGPLRRGLNTAAAEYQKESCLYTVSYEDCDDGFLEV